MPIVRTHCPVIDKDVEIDNAHPYAHQCKTFVKERDQYPSLLCDCHCYVGDATPEGCLYRFIEIGRTTEKKG
jgi:hypothetical protein